MQTLKDLLELNSDAIVFFCFKKRRRADLQFVKMAKKAFLVEEIYDEDRPVFSRERLFLFSFRSRKAKVPAAKAARLQNVVDERKQAGLDTAAALGVKVKI